MLSEEAGVGDGARVGLGWGVDEAGLGVGPFAWHR